MDCSVQGNQNDPSSLVSSCNSNSSSMNSTMQMSSTKGQKSIQSLLLEAWRNRWSEIEWGIQIKQVLPRGVSGDVYDLAECILGQSLIGPTPNRLMLSYLIHSINSRIVSYGAVLEAVASNDDFVRHECVNILLDLISSFKNRIACAGNDEECLRLSKAILSISVWLFSLLKYFSGQIVDASMAAINNHSMIHVFTKTSSIFEKTVSLIYFISNSPFLRALFNVGRKEDPTLYSKLQTVYGEFMELESNHGLLSSTPMGNQISIDPDVSFAILNFLDPKVMAWDESTPSELTCQQLKSTPLVIMTNYKTETTAFSSLNAIIAFNAILNPVSDVDKVADQILTIGRLYDMPMSDLYCEIIRACFIGLVDACSSAEKVGSVGPVGAGSGEELKWAAFTFLKIPQLLQKLETMVPKMEATELSASRAKTETPTQTEIDRGIEKLMQFTPLLDLTDAKSNCDCLQLFLKELSKTELITETKVKAILVKRAAETTKSAALGKSNSDSSVNQANISNQAGSSLILKAEPTVTSILRTLDADYSKNQEGLLGVLCHMVPGKSFELILNAAASTGKLKSFTAKLLKFNEFNKQVSGEGVKASQTRALLFDVTFLMLCHISQNYGSEIITNNPEASDYFFVKWCRDCLPQDGKYRSPDFILRNCDQNRVDLLLTQFTSSETFKTSLVEWHEVCLNIPAAIKEVLLAWEQDAISTDKVKLILDNVKSKMCCLPIVISAWLSSYINVLHHDERLKPMNMLHQFTTPYTDPAPAPEKKGSPTSESENGSKEAPPTQVSPTPEQPSFYKERSTLMSAIIKKMLFDLHPPTQTKSLSKSGISNISHGLTSKISFNEIIENSFGSAHSRSWLDLKTIHDINTLYHVAGPVNFVDCLIRQLLKFETSDDLSRAVGLIFGLFHLDLIECTLALLTKVIPEYLLNGSKHELLFEPKASSLARLMVIAIYASFNFLSKNQESANISKAPTVVKTERDEIKKEPSDRKISLQSLHMMDSRLPNVFLTMFEDSPYFIRRQQELLESGSKDSSSFINEELTRDPFKKAVANLMILLSCVAADSEVAQRTLFPMVFLEQLILCSKEKSKQVLQYMPLETIMSLIRISPDNLTFEFLMAISSDLDQIKTRKSIAKSLCQLRRARNTEYSYLLSGQSASTDGTKRRRDTLSGQSVDGTSGQGF